MKKDKKNTAQQFVPIKSEELDFVVGGVTDIISLFRYECRCGWISDTLVKLPHKLICGICNSRNAKTFIRYAFVNGTWIKVDE